tara:strand:- start:620 stop:2473 length:1854 start_codon:yes stop_codon:yes gene_type:complete
MLYNKITSITDQPILNTKSDLLEAEKYANALSSFILESGTPLTIGMQGEWGTGKTSLMYMIKEKLDSFAEEENYAIATSWVNTWEYSMFKGVDQTTPAVLKGMLEKLKESCGDNWTLTDDVENKIKKVGSFLGNVANQIVSSQTGVDVKNAAGISSDSILADIAEIKADIKDVISDLINDEKNPYKRVVFFIDDLDRINPVDAVEVLESLKNIFDINDCIFILAIDYDVVVKGLEEKFGKKTDENEREFRSFFDKIIQVPFSMPTGAYNIENFLDQKLKELGIKIDEDILPKYVKVVSNTVGFNPRSLKRYLNTFSLLRKISEISDDGNNDKNDDFVLFNLIGIQVSFPRVFRLFNQFPKFLEWNEIVAAKFELGSMSELKKQSEQFNEQADEDWERVLFGLAQKDSYLKANWTRTAMLLDDLRNHFKKKEDLYMKIDGAMEFASMTSVDDAIESKTNKKFTFTVSNFDTYELWEEQRRKEDDKITSEMITIHKSIHDYIKSDYPEINIKLRKHGAALFHNNGKKVGNLNVFSKYGVTINLLRTEENGYKFPNICHQVKNMRNDTKGCEYYTIINIKSLDEDIKSCIKKSYDVRDKKLNLLKRNHPNVKEILGLSEV